MPGPRYAYVLLICWLHQRSTVRLIPFTYFNFFNIGTLQSTNHFKKLRDFNDIDYIFNLKSLSFDFIQGDCFFCSKLTSPFPLHIFALYQISKQTKFWLMIPDTLLVDDIYYVFILFSYSHLPPQKFFQWQCSHNHYVYLTENDDG